MRLQDYRDVAEATDLQSLEDRLVHFAHELGFGLISGALVIEDCGGSTRTLPFGNTPSAFAETSESVEIGQRSPVMQRLKRLSIPFIYDQSMHVKEKAADIWDVQATFGYKTGIAMALHMPHRRHFLLGIDREEVLPSDEQTLMRWMADLQLLAVYAVDAVTRQLVMPASDFSLARRPTSRELEVLRWTLAGKTAWEVVMLLNISERTAAIHANRATHKLECVSKHQAALRAMQLGLI